MPNFEGLQPFDCKGAFRLTWDNRGFAVTGEEGEFLKTLVKWIKPKFCLEIGTYVGVSSSWIIEGLQEVGGGVYHGCDIVPLYLEEARKRLGCYPQDFWKLYLGPPNEDVVYDFIYIDDSHVEEAVIKSYAYAKAHSRPGTLIALHDIILTDVQKAIKPDVATILKTTPEKQVGLGLIVV